MSDDGNERGTGSFWDRLQSLPSETTPGGSVHDDADYWHKAPRKPGASSNERGDATAIGQPPLADPGPAARSDEPRGHVVIPPAVPPSYEPPAPPRPSPARKRRRRRGTRSAVLRVLLVFAVLLVGVLALIWYRFEAIDRVEVDGTLASGGSGTNYLIVGSDSREGLDSDDPALAGAEDLGGQRADTMIILRVDGSGATMLSIPRDLWVTLAPDGGENKINAAFNAGAPAVIRTINGIGIPIHRYMEVDFASFQGLVDAVGGVTINFAHPARDPNSGLLVEATGDVHLDGDQALAYVRSRHYEELIDGSWREDPRADLGRIERQKAFMAAVLGELGATRNPLRIDRALRAADAGLRIDDEMTLIDALRMGWSLRGADYETVEIPVENFRAPNGSLALRMLDGSGEIITRFGE